jgi:hypothetical protein
MPERAAVPVEKTLNVVVRAVGRLVAGRAIRHFNPYQLAIFYTLIEVAIDRRHPDPRFRQQVEYLTRSQRPHGRADHFPDGLSVTGGPSH